MYLCQRGFISNVKLSYNVVKFVQGFGSKILHADIWLHKAKNYNIFIFKNISENEKCTNTPEPQDSKFLIHLVFKTCCQSQYYLQRMPRFCWICLAFMYSKKYSIPGKNNYSSLLLPKTEGLIPFSLKLIPKLPLSSPGPWFSLE